MFDTFLILAAPTLATAICLAVFITRLCEPRQPALPVLPTDHKEIMEHAAYMESCGRWERAQEWRAYACGLGPLPKPVRK